MYMTYEAPSCLSGILDTFLDIATKKFTKAEDIKDLGRDLAHALCTGEGKIADH